MFEIFPIINFNMTTFDMECFQQTGELNISNCVELLDKTFNITEKVEQIQMHS